MAGYGMVGLQPQGDDCNTSDHHSLSSVNVKYFTVQSVDCCRSYGIIAFLKLRVQVLILNSPGGTRHHAS